MGGTRESTYRTPGKASHLCSLKTLLPRRYSAIYSNGVNIHKCVCIHRMHGGDTERKESEKVHSQHYFGDATGPKEVLLSFLKKTKLDF